MTDVSLSDNREKSVNTVVKTCYINKHRFMACCLPLFQILHDQYKLKKFCMKNTDSFIVAGIVGLIVGVQFPWHKRNK